MKESVCEYIVRHDDDHKNGSSAWLKQFAFVKQGLVLSLQQLDWEN